MGWRLRRGDPTLAALEAIARRSTRVFTAETMPWQRLRRPQVLRIRSLLEESYLPATANRMLSALRGVLRECWHSGLVGMEEYRLAVDVEPVRRESEPRGRDLSAGELHGLLEACARAPLAGQHRQDSVTRRQRDAAFLSLLYASGLRRAEAVALEFADLDLVNGQLRVRRGKGREPRSISLPASALPALQDWLEVRGDEPGPLFSAVLKNGRLVRDPQRQLLGLSGSAAWAICKERGRKAGIQRGGACFGLDHGEVRSARSYGAAESRLPATCALRRARRLIHQLPSASTGTLWFGRKSQRWVVGPVTHRGIPCRRRP